MFALDKLRMFNNDRREALVKKDARYFRFYYFISSLTFISRLILSITQHISVALSCTVNLSRDGLQDYFEEEFLTRAASSYHLPTSENRTKMVLDQLQKLLPRRDVRFVLEEVRILKGRYKEQQRAGEIVPEHCYAWSIGVPWCVWQTSIPWRGG